MAEIQGHEYETLGAQLVAQAMHVVEEFTPTDDPSPGGLVARVWAELSQLSVELSRLLGECGDGEEEEEEEEEEADAFPPDRDVDPHTLALRCSAIAAIALGAAIRTDPEVGDHALLETKEVILRKVDSLVAETIARHGEDAWSEFDVGYWPRAVTSLLFGAATGAANLGGVFAPDYEESERVDEDDWSALISESLLEAGVTAAVAAQWYEELDAEWEEDAFPR